MAAGGGGGGSSGAVEAGKAFVRVFVDDKGVQGKLAAIANGMKSFGGKVAGVGLALAGGGAALLGPLIGFAHQAIEAGSVATDLAERLGTTTDVIQGLGYAAELSGGSIEDVEGSLAKMQKAIAGGGNFGSLNLDALADQDLLTQVKAFADEIKGMPNAALQGAAAIEIFGKSGRKMLPFLKEGSAGIDKMFARGKSIGAIMDTKDTANLDKVGDALSEIWMVIKSIGVAIGIAFIGGSGDIENFTDTVIAIGQTVRAFIQDNAELIRIVGAVGAGLIAVGTAFAVVGSAIAMIGVAISGAVAGFTALVAVFAAVLSPIGLIVAGVAATGASIAYLLYNFTSMGAIFEKSWGGIAAAIKKGDLGLAMEIAWLGAKLVFQSALAWMHEQWIDFTSTMSRVWEMATTGWAVALASALEGIIGDQGFASTLIEDSNRAMDEIEASRISRKAAANADADATRAALDAAVAKAQAVEAAVEKKVDAVAKVAAAVGGNGPTAGGFMNSAFAQAIGVGSETTMKSIEKNTKRSADKLDSVGPLLCAP